MAQTRGAAMVKWRNKSIEELSKSELQYALQDAVEALTLKQAMLNEDSLYRGLIYGLLAGASVTAFSIMLFMSI
ncbi:MAG: hypothetical protein ABJQ85_17260 [Rhizobiaceae bacterium]